MAKTVIGFGNALAEKKWSGSLFLDSRRKAYFDRKFTGDSDNHVIQRLTDLEQEAGDTIQFDLSVQLRQKPTKGDERLEGNEEALRFFSDDVKIDQLRHGVSAGGKMSRKRTTHNTRKIARARLSDYWSAYFDELTFIYLSGARGINQDFIEDTAFVGHAGNTLNAPDSGHILYGGDATGKADIVAADKMTRAVVERATVKARTMRSLDPSTANMMPVMINGEAHYVCLMSPFQEHDMRTNDSGGWLEIQKAAAASEGKSNPIFKGGLGMINNCVLHSHENVIRFSDYGAGTNLPAARALFMGRQAGAVAYGGTGGLRFTWNEELADHKNEPRIASGTIMGIKKSRFNGKDFGVLAIDTAAADPNAA